MENIEEKYSKFRNIKLNELHSLFSKKAYDELISLNIDNLGELFEQENSGSLIKIFYQKHKDAHELWNAIYGTIRILKCKYLNINPEIDIYDDSYEFTTKIGLSRSVRKRILCFQNLKLSDLLKMVKNNDYGLLYVNFSLEVVEEIISKISILKEYFESQKQEISVDDLKDLYKKLASLIDEYEKITNEISIVQTEIDKRTKGGNIR